MKKEAVVLEEGVVTHWRTSPMDTERFGVRTARADAGTSAQELPGVVASCRDAGITLLIARCSAEDITLAQAMEDAGLRLMDSQVLYARALDEKPRRPHVDVRRARPADLRAVVDIARDSFTGYAGHYHADPRLSRRKCDEVYADWAERCCRGDAADTVLVVELDGRLAGFSAFEMLGGSEARLQLGAVAPWARGRRLYTEMALAGMRWAGDTGASVMSAITQTTNLPAQHSWLRAGMTPRDYWHTFHGWLD